MNSAASSIPAGLQHHARVATVETERLDRQARLLRASLVAYGRTGAVVTARDQDVTAHAAAWRDESTATGRVASGFASADGTGSGSTAPEVWTSLDGVRTEPKKAVLPPGDPRAASDGRPQFSDTALPGYSEQERGDGDGSIWVHPDVVARMRQPENRYQGVAIYGYSGHVAEPKAIPATPPGATSGRSADPSSIPGDMPGTTGDDSASQDTATRDRSARNTAGATGGNASVAGYEPGGTPVVYGPKAADGRPLESDTPLPGYQIWERGDGSGPVYVHPDVVRAARNSPSHAVGIYGATRASGPTQPPIIATPSVATPPAAATPSVVTTTSVE